LPSGEKNGICAPSVSGIILRFEPIEVPDIENRAAPSRCRLASPQNASDRPSGASAIWPAMPILGSCAEVNVQPNRFRGHGQAIAAISSSRRANCQHDDRRRRDEQPGAPAT
jgi:hypothetical protein